MRNKLWMLFAPLIAVLIVGGPITYKRRQDRQCRNFHVVEEGVLYRSGQLPLSTLRQLVAKHGIRTVVTLREKKDPVDLLDHQEETWFKGKSLNFVRIPPRSWWRDAAGKVPADASLKTFRAVMDDPANYPVLVHCFAGIHRTGTMCAIFRMDYQGWTSREAMAEMRTIGYSILDGHEDVHGYLLRYRPQPGNHAPPVSGRPVKWQVDAP